MLTSSVFRFLLFAGCTIVYLWIGYLFGELNIRTWKKGKNYGTPTKAFTILLFLLWPCTLTGLVIFGTSEPTIEELIRNDRKELYEKTIMIIWPLKIIWNIIVILLMMIISFLIKVISKILDIVSYPLKKILTH